MGLVWIALQPVSDGAYRYVRDIEKQFEAQPPGKALLEEPADVENKRLDWKSQTSSAPGAAAGLNGVVTPPQAPVGLSAPRFLGNRPTLETKGLTGSHRSGDRMAAAGACASSLE